MNSSDQHNQIPANLRKKGQALAESDPETYAIIGAAMAVHRELGCGFLENVYQAALAKEFEIRNIPFEQEKEISVFYRDSPLDVSYRADFICFREIIVELKALKELTGHEEAQVINYLKATKFQRAILLNFGTPSLKYQRLVLNYPST